MLITADRMFWKFFAPHELRPDWVKQRIAEAQQARMAAKSTANRAALKEAVAEFHKWRVTVRRNERTTV